MQILQIGASGYTGRATAAALLAAGHTVTGLARSEQTERKLAEAGVHPRRGDLRDLTGLRDAARAAEGVVYTAALDGPPGDPAEAAAILALLDALRGSGKPFLLLGGSLVYGDTGTEVFDEGRPFNPPPFLAGRAAFERQVLDAAATGVRTMVVHAALVYGDGGGAIPATLLRSARQSGAAAYIDDGANAWSTVHVADLGDLIARAVASDLSGAALNAAGPALTMREVAEAVGQALALPGPPRSLSPQEAQPLWGFFAGPLALNQRYRAERAAALGWAPRGPGLAPSVLMSTETG